MSSNNTVGLGLLTILPINFTITTAGRELHVYRYIESESIYIYCTYNSTLMYVHTHIYKSIKCNLLPRISTTNIFVTTCNGIFCLVNMPVNKYICIWMISFSTEWSPFLHSTKEGWSMMSTSQGRSRGGRPFGGSRNPWAFEGVSPVYITRLRAEDSKHVPPYDFSLGWCDCY